MLVLVYPIDLNCEGHLFPSISRNLRLFVFTILVDLLLDRHIFMLLFLLGDERVGPEHHLLKGVNALDSIVGSYIRRVLHFIKTVVLNDYRTVMTAFISCLADALKVFP